MKKKTLIVNLPSELHKQFKILAASKDTDMTSVINDLVKKWIKKNSIPPKNDK